MKQTLLFLFALGTTIATFSQSTDLDREPFRVSYVELPKKPILDDTRRTYSVNSNIISISGFSRVQAPGTLDLNYKFKGTTTGEVDIAKIKHEKKDDDGKVISVRYTYQANTHFTSTATLYTINADNGDNFEKTFSSSSDYSSKEFSSYAKAESHYNNNKYDIRSSHRVQHKRNIQGSINSYLNSNYGYVPYTNSSKYFWVLDSKKHPEYAKHQEAYHSLRTIFQKMEYDQPMDQIKKEVAPIITYYESVIPKYPGDKRKMKKIRFASYYNIAKIYYYLDMPDKVREYANKIITNDFDKTEGKGFLRSADALTKTLKTNQTTTRHMQVLTEDISNLQIEEEQPAPVNIAAPNPEMELNKAYLITKDNDTLLVDINTSDISTIGYKLKTVEFTKAGTPIATRAHNAKNYKEVLFVNGLHFKNIAFTESSSKPDIVDTALNNANNKLCRVLFESKKIGLYHFNDKELVIKTPTQEKGKSTMGASFVFGFNKNLSKYAEGCAAVVEKVSNKAYQNNAESLLSFCKDVTACKN